MTTDFHHVGEFELDRFDLLRSGPRYHALVNQIGLPPAP
jgi:hypothetical protein